ncbi:bis(5'-nucleosyl)-tetraphosphatase (symmetrical) YqeK [Acetivibrio clariflavus]|uniref:bis(5'-nucleosyl)-tetraphosphatase (symmetrical) n=1 Tax=Acetivibrio clariflavus (strain DSM 19732 / NBRC 101661 / EBR45) TaxID=720554 RepID=G8LV09_ACECE|nr:bis(5'-nucleosyl)-tetraphosphatase (symmetrical) YqeK [Acetivibrio clariflavus]AEV69586.1 putative HD superfamily hydrolase of NAD metabolism [Acetivibrio clariflavus DSM 19732]
MYMTIQQIHDRLKEVLSPKRFKHSLGVMETAVKLAAQYGVDAKKAELAGLLHDCAREMAVEDILKICRQNNIKMDDISLMQPKLLHGPAGSIVAREVYGIEDEEILSAIYCHTTGRKNMSTLDKIIFLADYIEPGRDFPGVDKVREAVFEDLDKGMVVSLMGIIRHLVEKRGLIQIDTIDTWNFIINSYREKEIL